MAHLGTLIVDIYTLLDKREGTDLVLDEWVHHGANMTQHIHKAISEDAREARDLKVLYASEIGKPCLRQVYYKLTLPERAEPLPPWTKFKFLYGNLIEESTIALAKAAGHDVSREQESVELRMPNGWTVRGRIDCVIDGHVVDVKSMAPFSFAAVKEEGLTDATDKFGYRAQTDFYAKGLGLPQPTIWAVDKVNGHMTLADAQLWKDKNAMYDELLAKTGKLSMAIDASEPPSRAFGDEPEGAKGNMKLCTQCSYCDYKHECWPGLRGFAYAKGPVWLTQVKELPKVKEITHEQA